MQLRADGEIDAARILRHELGRFPSKVHTLTVRVGGGLIVKRFKVFAAFDRLKFRSGSRAINDTKQSVGKLKGPRFPGAFVIASLNSDGTLKDMPVIDLPGANRAAFGFVMSFFCKIQSC